MLISLFVIVMVVGVRGTAGGLAEGMEVVGLPFIPGGPYSVPVEVWSHLSINQISMLL